MAEGTEKKVTPPYLAFATVKTFIESLHNTAVPPVIDKSLMRHLSGAVQSHLMAALKFLNLISPKGDVGEGQLEQLAKAFNRPEEWKAILGRVVAEAYTPIIGDLDIAKITDKQLDDAFKTATNLDGTMLERATRFYIQALTEAKVTVSPHLLNRKKRNPKRSGPKTSKNGTDAANGVPKPETAKADVPAATRTVEVAPMGTIEFPLHFKNKTAGVIRVPQELNDDDVKSIELMVQVVKAYAAQKAVT